MSQHTAVIRWTRHASEPFHDNKYSRRHSWSFDGGVVVPASSSPHVVRVPLSASDAVDPEEAFVASLSSCHMLWFLNLAALAGFVVESYDDAAMGTMGHNAAGRMAMLEVVLHPVVTFAGASCPSPEAFDALHHQAHDSCYLAASVVTVVRCESTLRT
jgi:organic hydroperoxide reductase OsmC/OhrA